MLSWYVMHSKPQKEQWLCKQLSDMDVEVYYPCLHVKRSRFEPRAHKPYFPGYLFVNVNLDETGRSVLRWLPGSLGLVAFGDEPACVPEGLLQRIRCRVDEINHAEENVLCSLKPGDEVVIRSGPFAGFEGIFCAQLRGSERAQILLKVLQDQNIHIDLPLRELISTNQKRNLL